MIYSVGRMNNEDYQQIESKRRKWNFEKFLSAAKEIADCRRIPVCDCYQKWKALADSGVNTTNLLANYINHPTPEMNWLFAYSLAETMFFN